nr:hypothetical protein CJLB15_00012 [Campylobacter phage CJLB-15]
MKDYDAGPMLDLLIVILSDINYLRIEKSILCWIFDKGPLTLNICLFYIRF